MNYKITGSKNHCSDKLISYSSFFVKKLIRKFYIEELKKESKRYGQKEIIYILKSQKSIPINPDFINIWKIQDKLYYSLGMGSYFPDVKIEKNTEDSLFISIKEPIKY